VSAPGAAIAPVTFTDKTSREVTGLTWRQARGFCLLNNVPIAKVGRRSVVSVARFVEAVDRAAGAEPRRAWDAAEVIELAARRGGR
jgi:hypothetical protein